MTPAQIDAAIVTALREGVLGDRVTLAALRRVVGAGTSGLEHAVARLRRQGRLQVDRLALSPSPPAETNMGTAGMIGSPSAPADAPGAPGAGAVEGVRTSTAPLAAPRPRAPDALNLVEAIQTLLAEEPADLARAVGRAHAEYWRRCVLLGRAARQTPATMLYRAIGAGLDVIEGGERHG